MTKAQVIKEKLDARLLRRTFVPAFEFDDQKVHELVKEIGKNKPYIVDGYAESLDYLTKVASSKTVGSSPRIPAIMSSAQTLTSQTRSILENFFDAKVYDKYGSREFSGIAYQCGFGPWFHVMSDSYIVEILVDGSAPAGPGQVGEVVVTDLNNRLFPMIRYRIGDLATAIDPNEQCECGRKMPKIGNIVGRTAALIITPKNRVLPGTFFAHFFKDYELIVFQYQIIQEDPESILLKVVKGRSFSSEGLESLLFSLSEFLDNLKVRIEFVEVIPLGRTGKRSPVVSMLNVRG
jgi:phenylacetate-CoA ligase